jgi:triosephosphate isomerase
MYCEEKGAYTGEVSYLMLKSLCSYVILGHSERRQIFGETDELVNKKVIKAIENSLTPIVCIGETLEQNEAGETENVLAKQIKESLKNINKDDDIIVAYEPIWAIGTGKAATSDQAEDTIKFIRSVISKKFGAAFAKKTRLLYGGSVKPSNALELMSKENIDGVLVGGASLKADDFNSIILAASEASN